MQCKIRMDVGFAAGALAAMLISGSVLVVSDWCRDALGLIASVVMLAAVVRTWPLANLKKVALAALFVVLLRGAFWLDEPVLRLVGLAWILACLYVVEASILRRPLNGEPTPGPRAQAKGRESALLGLHWGTLGYAVFLDLYGSSDRVWFALRGLLDAITGPRASIGVWTSALPVYVLGFIVLACSVGCGGVKRLSVAAVVLGGAFALGTRLLAAVEPATAATLSVLQALAVFLVSGVVSSAALGRRAATRLALISILPAVLVSVWLAASVQFHDGARQAPSAASSAASGGPVRFALCSSGLLDWNVPAAGKLGLANSGMFGLFRQALERRAAKMGGSVIPFDSPTEAALSHADVAIFINPTKHLGGVEISVLREFVAAGGGLLVLGDHTGIGGSMGPLRAILAFTSIRFNFDSAIPLRRHWRGCLEVRQHAVVSGVGESEAALQLAVGASLDVRPPAFPIVVGRYGFGDLGDVSNGGSGANMGNVLHERGERVGDVVLVAAEHVGRGRVLVFGDTSPFQNGALFLSGRLVHDSIGWLAGEEPAWDQPGDRWLADEVAVVDFSLKPGARLSLFDESSLSGLANCLARCGIAAKPGFSTDDWTSGRYLFLVDPSAVLGRAAAARLVRYIAQGGHVILCQAYAPAAPCGTLLSHFGFAVSDMPLGGGDADTAVEHKEAWPILYRGDADTTVLASAFGYATAVAGWSGRGSLTVISDGRFLLDGNLEAEQSASAANVAFLERLIGTLREGCSHGTPQVFTTGACGSPCCSCLAGD